VEGGGNPFLPSGAAYDILRRRENGGDARIRPHRAFGRTRYAAGAESPGIRRILRKIRQKTGFADEKTPYGAKTSAYDEKSSSNLKILLAIAISLV
jgi:hypothetical protein